MTPLKAIWLVATIAICIITASMNAAFGYGLAPDPFHAILLASGAVFVDVLKWIALPIWRQAQGTGPKAAALVIFVISMSYSFAAAFGFAVLNRHAAAGIHQAAADSRARSLADHQRLTRDLALAEVDPLWKATAACTKPAGKSQRAFCEAHRQRQLQATALATRVEEGGTRDPDPQARLLADLTGLTLINAQRTLAMTVALVLEVIACLGLYAITRPAGTTQPRAIAERVSWWQRGRRRVRPKTKPEALSEPAAASSTRSPAAHWPRR